MTADERIRRDQRFMRWSMVATMLLVGLLLAFFTFEVFSANESRSAAALRAERTLVRLEEVIGQLEDSADESRESRRQFRIAAELILAELGVEINEAFGSPEPSPRPSAESSPAEAAEPSPARQEPPSDPTERQTSASPTAAPSPEPSEPQPSDPSPEPSPSETEPDGEVCIGGLACVDLPGQSRTRPRSRP